MILGDSPKRAIGIEGSQKHRFTLLLIAVLLLMAGHHALMFWITIVFLKPKHNHQMYLRGNLLARRGYIIQKRFF